MSDVDTFIRFVQQLRSVVCDQTVSCGFIVQHFTSRLTILVASIKKKGQIEQLNM